MRMQFIVNIDLAVWDAAALLEAARVRALAESSPTEELTTEDGEPNIPACLQMLLDPGSLAGCEIYGSTAEECGGAPL
jgi:hypothetical protein